MKKEAVVLGQHYQCAVKEDMEAPFVGQVDKLYENSALLTIVEYNSKKDKANVEELNHRIVVNFKQFIKETKVKDAVK
ncbi:DUF2187 domain-containing protein [Agrilactobacillus yilanensis]|uniref:DUF2187 domain-containing protein n=1 Tax=Agrilactobacillus yilanensis TaxID=2485997 RepID=A0ABW4J5E6_9LACO|nr:DUF2187 domain-containing protein [Agrilactobacillus yilanensis]